MSYECVPKCGKPCKPTDTINEGKWDSLQLKAQNWSGLDKFGDVYTTTLWEDGPTNHYMHSSCCISISSSAVLKQARRRKDSESKNAQCSRSEMPVQSALCDEEAEGPSPKRLRSSVGGPLHDKTLSLFFRWWSCTMIVYTRQCMYHNVNIVCFVFHWEGKQLA